MTQGIYCIENTINKKKYIGSSINVYKRRNRHFSELKNLKHKNHKLQSSYNKYGEECFEFYVLEIVENKEELIIREQFFIDNEKPFFNINLIANSSLGVKRSDETKEKIRQANLGLKHPEWRNKIKSDSQGGENHWTKNKSFSEESKLKMSQSQKELYENGYIHPLLGTTASDDTRYKQRIVKIKPVEQYDLDGNFIKCYESVSDVVNDSYLTKYVIDCCKNRRSKYKKCIWKYKETSV